MAGERDDQRLTPPLRDYFGVFPTPLEDGDRPRATFERVDDASDWVRSQGTDADGYTIRVVAPPKESSSHPRRMCREERIARVLSSVLAKLQAVGNEAAISGHDLEVMRGWFDEETKNEILAAIHCKADPLRFWRSGDGKR